MVSSGRSPGRSPCPIVVEIMSGITAKTTLVTGGGSGIGLGTATRFATDGAHVTICGRTEDRLARACEQIKTAAGPGATVQYVVADVTSEEQVGAAMARAAEPTGALDI